MTNTPPPLPLSPRLPSPSPDPTPPNGTAAARALPHRRRFGLRARLTAALLAVAVGVAGLVTLALLLVARQQVLSDLRHRLADITGVAVLAIDGDRMARVVPTLGEAGMTTPEFVGLIEDLRRVRDHASDVRFVYALRRLPDGTLVFVGDAEEVAADFAPLGKVYDDASPFLRARAETLAGPVVEPAPYTDQWGSWLSAYAPILTSTGERAGILGVDISASVLRAYQQRVVWTGMALLAVTLPIGLALGLGLGRTLTRPLETLTKGARSIAGGDLSVRLRLPDGDEIGTLARAFDTMAEALAEAQEAVTSALAEYRRLFESTSEGLVQVTPDGQVLAANRAMLDMLGQGKAGPTSQQHGTPDEAAPPPLTCLTDMVAEPADRARLGAALARGETLTGLELPLVRANGSRFWGDLAVRVPDPATPTVLEVLVLDVTERHQRRQAERDREAARAANEAKSAFLANMSHEIRTPLNAIMGLTDLVLRSELTPRQRDYLAKVKVSSAALLALINDILDFSKIEAGGLDLEETGFSLDEVLANLTEMFAYRAHERDIELVISADPDVPRALIGDPVRLGQILINLVGNAIKFTEHGDVAVTVSRAAPAAATNSAPATADEDTGPSDRIALRFDVRDTGPGIPADRLEAIFNAFSQADSSITRRHGGTGLGLAISRQIAELMDGRLTVSSRVGEGSTFSAIVTLRRAGDAVQPRPVTPADLRGLVVLVADDNATARQILVDQIESFGMRAVPAADGTEALALLADPANSFDLVLMDWKMPGINGLETARRIRTDLKLQKTPVVCMISAYAREDLMQQADRSILDAFLHKPVNQSFLFDTIVTLFGHPDAALTRDGLARPGGPEPTEAPPDLSGRRVLLVEDIEVNRLVAEEWLTSVGLVVDQAENGQVALDLVDPTRHAAVLMDLQMPVMDGLEATRRLRARPGLESLPIIAMTAHALKGDVDRCLAAGMTDYLAKPIDPTRLFAVLRRWIPEVQPAAMAADGDIAPPTTAPAAPPADPSAADGVGVSEEAAAVLAACAPLAGIKTSLGLARANGNAALYLKLLRRVKAGWDSRLLERIETTLATGDRAEAHRLVHSMKGVAGTLGAEEVFAWGERAEAEIATGGALVRTRDPWRGFCLAVEAIQAGLRDLPDAANPAPGPAPGPAPAGGERDGGSATPTWAPEADGPTPADLADRLNRLVALLDDDLGEAQKEIGRLRGALGRLVGLPRVDALQAMIEDFDIDAAIDAVRALQKDMGSDDH